VGSSEGAKRLQLPFLFHHSPYAKACHHFRLIAGGQLGWQIHAAWNNVDSIMVKPARFHEALFRQFTDRNYAIHFV